MSIYDTATHATVAKTHRSATRSFVHSRHVTAVAAVSITLILFSAPPVLAEGISEFLAIAQQTKPNDVDRDATKLGAESIFGGNERLPTIIEGGRLTLPSITTATTETSAIGNGSLPKSYTGLEGTAEEVLREQISQRDAMWAESRYEFAASNTFSHPLYFEDVMLERHGHERFPKLTPMISGARFFATVPMLPYLMTVRPACDYEYKMGHCRSGDSVYPYIQRPPYVRNAAIVEAAAIAGASIALP
jgi:hypothetical protein